MNDEEYINLLIVDIQIFNALGVFRPLLQS